MPYFLYNLGGDARATLGDVLSFATGADVPPVLGFYNSPVIAFTDMAFATANTCATTLRLPTVYGSYDEFKEKMDFSTLNSPCFGHKSHVLVLTNFRGVFHNHDRFLSLFVTN